MTQTHLPISLHRIGWRFATSTIRLLLPAIALAWALGQPCAGQQLLFLEAEFDGVGGVDGLDNAHAVVVSPDGAHVYVASDTDDAVAVFSRDAMTGKLTFVEVEKDGVGGVDGLDGTEHLALDPTGSHLYVAGLLDGAVALFSRNAGTGALTFVQAYFDGDPGINGLAGASWVAVSPDGLNVYVAGRFDDALAVFSRNTSNGLLTFVEVQLDGMGGVDGLQEVTSAAVSPDGMHVYAASAPDQKLAIFSRGMGGALTFVNSLADALPEGDIDIDDHRSLAFSPDGKHLYLANHVEDLADGWIAVFERNAASGLLTLVTPVLLGNAVDNCFLGIEGDSGLAVSPDGTLAFANLTFDTSLVMFGRNAATGRLTVLDGACEQTIGMSGTPGELDGLWGNQSVAVSPDGNNVYVASGNLEDAVAVFRVSFEPPPAFTKAFSPAAIGVGQVSTLTFNISNTEVIEAANLDFTDNLPASVTIANPPNAATTCTGGMLTAVAGTSVVSYSGGTVAAGSSCQVSVDVTSSTAGTHINTSGDLTSSLGNSGTAGDSLTVVPPPVFSKAFNPNLIGRGGVAVLTLTIDNTGSSIGAASLNFTDNLPAGVAIANPANAGTTCGGGMLTAVAGTGLISYSGGTAAAGTSCTVSVDVTSSTAGTHTNTSGDLTSTLGNSGSATAMLTVDADTDGIPVAIENQAPNGGDGNNDGMLDSSQDNVASLPTFDGSSFMTLVLQSGCTEIRKATALSPTSQPQIDTGFQHPFGLVAFELPCESALLDIIYHGATGFPSSSYRKFGPTTPGNPATAQWYDFGAFAGVGGNTWSLDLADNRLGDDTGDDTLIVDQGGPATPEAPVAEVPALGPAGLAFLTVLLLVFGSLGAALRK